MTRSKKFKILFLTLNTICILGLFNVKATEKFPTNQGESKSDKSSLFTPSSSKYGYTLDVIDPQYEIEVRNGVNPYDEFNKDRTSTTYFMLDGKCVFYKKNGDGKYHNVNFRRIRNDIFVKRVYDYLPAADNKYEIKKSNSTGKIYYFYKGALVYRLVQEGNKIYYLSLKTGEKEFYSFKGKQEYYSTAQDDNFIYTSLPLPEDKINYNFFIGDNESIDPQYKIKAHDKSLIRPNKNYEKAGYIFYFTLDDKYRFYKPYTKSSLDDDYRFNKRENNRFNKVNFEVRSDFTPRYYYHLPAADDKYITRRVDGDLFYYHNGGGGKAYKTVQDGDTLYYVNAKTGERDFYSFIGKKEYYPLKKINNKENIIVYDNLPLPESVLDNKTIFKYRSPEYYDLVKKSKFFRPMTEEQFDEKYRMEKNNYCDYDSLSIEHKVLINNVRNNINKPDKDFKFVSGYENQPDEYFLGHEHKKGALEYFKEVGKSVEKILKVVKPTLVHNTQRFYSHQIPWKVIDPQYAIIKDNDIEWYCYDGNVKFFRPLKETNGFYDINGNFYDNLPRADQNSNYEIVKENDGLYYRANVQDIVDQQEFKVTNEGNKVWFSVRGNKKFYSIRGKSGYKTIHRNIDPKLSGKDKLNDVYITNIAEENQEYNKNNRYEYVPDPQYEVVHHNGKIIYFYEGLPRYIKVKNGYRDIESGRFYGKLPIVNSEYFWDKEYEVVRHDDKMFNGECYYYVDGVPVYKVVEQNEFNPDHSLSQVRLNYVDMKGVNRFHSIKGKRDYNVRVWPPQPHPNLYLVVKKLPID